MPAAKAKKGSSGEQFSATQLREQASRLCGFVRDTPVRRTNRHSRDARVQGDPVSTPAVVIAAPASGSGKTTVATGLMGALRRAGYAVAPFKVGPDFIDPGYHALAAGRPGRNLDPVLVGEDLIGPLYRHGCDGADIAVVEGVMGLFDGRIEDAVNTPAPASTAHVAALLGAPVVLVVDGRGQGHSIAALLHGFSTFDTTTRIAGVVLNRIGSARHEDVLRQACGHAGIPVVGAIPRTDELSVPSRHLGLITAIEHGRLARQAVDAMTALVAHHVDLPALLALANSRVADEPWDPAQAVGERAQTPATVAVAAGKAFSFGYAEHVELLTAAGADVAEFDPLTEPLPHATAALVLPGGFPEQFTAELSANDVARQQIRALAASGSPIHAECAGLTYLVSELDGHPMCGALSGSARFTERLTLAYRDAVAVADSALYTTGERVVGHEFHRTTVTFADSYQPAWVYRGRDVQSIRDGAIHRNVHASYLHTHPAARPKAIARFVAHAETSRLAG
jgi:cobyrinic acid a,c-diamide synthase